jgi:hypothetical protein
MRKLAATFVSLLLLAAFGHSQGETGVRQPSINLPGRALQVVEPSVPPDLLKSLEQTRPNLRQAATRGLGEADQLRLRLVVALLRERRNDEGLDEWQLLLTSTTQAQAQTAIDPNALVQYVLREAYLENAGDLSDYASKVQYFNQVKKELRAELEHARDLQATYGKADARFPPNGVQVREPVLPAPEGQPLRVTFGERTLTSPKALADHTSALEASLQTVGDDAQLANVDLQNCLQKQQQTLQMISQIAKQLHDTAMAIIRKIGG